MTMLGEGEKGFEKSFAKHNNANIEPFPFSVERKENKMQQKYLNTFQILENIWTFSKGEKKKINKK